jgi:hypothetical protein
VNTVSGRAVLSRPLALRPSSWRTPLLACGLVLTLLLGALAANDPSTYRLTLALAAAGNLLVIGSRWPRAAAVLTLLFLPLLALVRRLLIHDAGWTQYDPLLLVAPVVAAFLVVKLFVLERREFAADGISKLVAALLALTALQSFNPLLGSLSAGAGGFMFLGVPLLWFFIGREVADRQVVERMLYCVVGLAVVIGAYGLWQTDVGMPSWDRAWVDLNGYEALNLYGVTRAFGTFSSSAEYAIFLGVAIAISVAMLVHRRVVLMLAVPLLAVPLFLAGGRGVLVLTVLAALFAAGLRTRSTRLAIVIVIGGLVTAAAILSTYAPPAGGPSASANPFVTRQVSGLTNPLDPEHSTLLTHLDLVSGGIEEGITHPFGQGTAVTNIAADRFGIGTSAKGTEVDVSNAFVSLGLLGGLLFVAIIVVTFRRIVISYLRRPDPVMLAVLALLIVPAGQWLNGGHYALAPLTWFLIGWATAGRQYARD